MPSGDELKNFRIKLIMTSRKCRRLSYCCSISVNIVVLESCYYGNYVLR